MSGMLGGGGQSPSGSSTTYNAVSAYAAPYVNNMLGQGAALTSQPYQAYPGQQNANFTDLQNQSFTGVGNLGTTGQLGQATTAANQATNNLLGTSYNPSQATAQQFTDPGVASSYMNPYLQQSLAPQLQALQQQQGLQQQQLQSQATQQGAFGNSRFGLAQGAQNQANQLATSNLLGQGYNTAYNNAQQQFNADQSRNMQAQGMNIGQQQFGANLGLQGNQAAISGANTLGNLGQSQYAQNTGILDMQNQYGTQQQQQQQNILNTQQQNFQNQLNYPYQQLSFMQGLLSGLPMSQSTTQMYQSPGSQVAQLGGTLLGGYGAYKGLTSKAEGGSISSYAGGGDVESVSSDPMSVSSIRAMIAKMSQEQLQKERQILLNRQDPQGKLELQLVDERLGISEQPANPQQGSVMNNAVPQSPPGNSIASAVTPEMADQMVQTAANGGIMGFAGGGSGNSSDAKDVGYFDPVSGEYVNEAPTENAGFLANFAKSIHLGEGEKINPRDIIAKQQAAERTPKAVTQTTEQTSPVTEKTSPAVSKVSNPFTQDVKPETKVEKKSTAGHQHVENAVNSISSALNIPKDDLMERAKANYEMYKNFSKSDMDKLDEFIENQRPKDTKDRDFWDAVTKFGFTTASNASKPGATALKAIAESTPAFSDSIMASRKASQDLQDNFNKLKMNQAQYQIALNKGDMQSATALATQQRTLEMQQAQLAELSNYHKSALGIEREKLAQSDLPADIRGAMFVKDHPEVVGGLSAIAKARGYGPDLRAKTAEQLALERDIAAARAKMPLLSSGMGSGTDAYKKQETEFLKFVNQKVMAHNATNPDNPIDVNQMLSAYGSPGISSATPKSGIPTNLFKVEKIGG